VSLARAIVLSGLRRVRGGRLEVVEPEGRTLAFGPGDAELRARVEVHDPRAWRKFLIGSHGMGEAYIERWWDCDDLVALTRIGARDLPRLDGIRRLLAPVKRLIERVPRNTIGASRRHIAAHYDLGNELFETFLDETMTYSCAAFDDPGMTLREAQEAKLERICRKLELTPDDHLLEIGSGWGGLAIHAAGNYGCRVTTTTISREQYALATQRVAEAGLDDRVTILLEDYRNLQGRYDKLVSIEMIEAVGWQYFDTYFRKCADLLAAGGRMLLQAITIDHRWYDLEKAARTFANTWVFPAGCLPSLEVIRRCAGRAGLAEVGLEDLTASYPTTLSRWRENFVAAADRVAELGYDERFKRLWKLYLSWSEGGFRERRIQDYQVLLAPKAAATGRGEVSLAARG
jgi:cyclopropane-fatty-acyl-phospholipid synthase